MWLINTTTLKLKHFLGKVPKYAILSHRWEDEELTFGDVTEASSHLSGYRKVKRFCEIAKSNGNEYGWADTCCIDKNSSAELSEAINSMYKWYRDSAVCYAYLMDVNDITAIVSSTWFTRGWTLQELLAPGVVKFFDKNWNYLCTKYALSNAIEKRTGISSRALRRFEPTEYCIAYCMSWAAKRSTTREEDRAYSLLGLFDVNMPLLYGEGSKAFQRLQEEIMRSSTDTSIFMWTGPGCETFGILADSPSSFVNIPDTFKSSPIPQGILANEGWTMNNAGIRLSSILRPYDFYINQGTWMPIFTLTIASLGSNLTNGPWELKIFLVEESGLSRYKRASINGVCWEFSRPKVVDVKYGRTPQELLIVRQKILESMIYRQPLIDNHFNLSLCPSVSGASGFTVHQRPLEGPRNNFESWPLAVRRSLTEEDVYGIVIEPGFVSGILAVLVIEMQDPRVPILCIGLGFDYDLAFFCVAQPFNSTEGDLLGAYYRFMQGNKISPSESFAKCDASERSLMLRLSRQEHFINDEAVAPVVTVMRTRRQSIHGPCYAIDIDMKHLRY